METIFHNRGLSGNALKLIAAAAMLCDHMGMLLFPGVAWMRIVGRLAFPVYAFMIAQGCRYTRSPLRYFLQIFLLAAACQIVYYFADGSLYFSILVTFCFSILMIFLLNWARERKSLWLAALFCLAAWGLWQLNRVVLIDYGFWGIMTPVFASAFQFPLKPGRAADRLDRLEIHLAMMAIPLLFLGWGNRNHQMWGLAALPLLACYSGKRGKGNLKYFFYIFYPTHLALLQVLQWLL